jgi:hypothetical protein
MQDSSRHHKGTNSQVNEPAVKRDFYLAIDSRKQSAQTRRPGLKLDRA